MSNIIYNAGLRDLLVNGRTFDAATYKVLLERSTSSYAPTKADASILDAAGLVEVSVASYGRQTITAPTITANNDSNLVEIDCDDVAFGNLETGQTVKAAIVYRDDGANGVPLLRVDTDGAGLLPRALGGGPFTLQLAAVGIITIQQSE